MGVDLVGGLRKKCGQYFQYFRHKKTVEKSTALFLFMNVDYSTVKVRQTLVVPSDSSPCVNKTRSPETK